MSKLGLIVSQEYKTSVFSKSFIISTFLVPVLIFIFGAVIGVLMANSDSLETVGSIASGMGGDTDKEMTGAQAMGMMCGFAMTMFVMTYGAAIFNKVKQEKTNRIIEVLATCVNGRTLMIAKVISIGLMGLTQLIAWGLILGILGFGCILIFNIEIPWNIVFSGRVIGMLLWCIGYFLGGYVFFGSLFAACGATTDRNNENQEYMSVLTFILIGSMYLGMFVVDHPSSVVATVFSFIPLTAPTCGVVGAVSGQNPIWLSLLSLLTLWAFAGITLILAGKIYTSSLLLMGKKLTPKDILTFLKSK